MHFQLVNEHGRFVDPNSTSYDQVQRLCIFFFILKFTSEAACPIEFHSCDIAAFKRACSLTLMWRTA